MLFFSFFFRNFANWTENMKKQFRKITAIGLIVLLGTCSLSAQTRKHKLRLKRHEVVLCGGGGMSSLQYKATAGKQSMGFGGQIGLGYNFFFIPQLNLGTGLEFALYSASFTMAGSSTTYMTTDIENNPFEFRSKINEFKENQTLIMLQVPLMLQFQTGAKHKFYVAVGGKFGLPLSGKYNSSRTNIQNSGYYAEEDYEYTTQRFMGFGTFKGSRGNLSFKMAFFASAETGVKFMMSDGYALYTGIYADYGLTNIANQPSEPLPFLQYNRERPSDFSVNSIVTSRNMQNGNAQLFTNKIVPLAVGIKLKMAF